MTIFGLAVLALAILMVALAISRVLDRWAAPWIRPLASLQALVTIAGIVIAGLWYFFDRPQAAKLNIDLKAEAVTLPDNRVLVLADVAVTNLGRTAVDFTRKPYEILVQQVTPLRPEVANEYTKENTRMRPRGMHGSEDWAQLARLSSETGDAGLTSFVEAGETESLYFRAILPCDPDLRVYVAARFRKPDSEMTLIREPQELYWVKQTFLDLSEKCRSAAAATPTKP